MNLLIYSLSALWTIDAILLAFFGVLYSTYVKYYYDASKENEELPDYIFYIGKANKFVNYLIIGTTLLFLFGLSVYFFEEKLFNSPIPMIFGIGLSLLSISIAGISYYFSITMKSKRG